MVIPTRSASEAASLALRVGMKKSRSEVLVKAWSVAKFA
jgi:hypothetical protein